MPKKLGIGLIIAVLIIALAVGFSKRKQIKQTAVNAINWINEKTWDFHSDRRINNLHPKIRAKAKEFIIKAEKQLGIKLRITSGLRTWAEQTKLYNQGRTTKGKIVTTAKAGQSYHNYGLAIDVVEIKGGKALWLNPNWEKIGQLGESLGFEWGGRWKNFKDKPHFHINFGKHHSELAQLYKSGKRNGAYVII